MRAALARCAAYNTPNTPVPLCLPRALAFLAYNAVAALGAAWGHKFAKAVAAGAHAHPTRYADHFASAATVRADRFELSVPTRPARYFARAIAFYTLHSVRPQLVFVMSLVYTS